MNSLCIYYFGSSDKIMGKLFSDTGEETSISIGETKDYISAINKLSKVPVRSIMATYAAVKIKFGSSCFESPISGWDIIDNRQQTKTYMLGEALKSAYKKSVYRYMFVLSLDVNRAAAILKIKDCNFCKMLVNSKVEKIHIITIG
jgi:hypothetical protein